MGGLFLWLINFYPRPPRGGRHDARPVDANELLFLSTPSARRATTPLPLLSMAKTISIHALREEGDVGGIPFPKQPGEFLSTPSARRATPPAAAPVSSMSDFYPRPPRGGRQGGRHSRRSPHMISIHALREEGDPTAWWPLLTGTYFYPRPPRGGRRSSRNSPRCFRAYFYPRPPRGGRPAGRTSFWADLVFLSTPSARRATAVAGPARYNAKFLSTPSARRATKNREPERDRLEISIHALREEGDAAMFQIQSSDFDFYPRPPRGGRRSTSGRNTPSKHFYPRPPRGGRLCVRAHTVPPFDFYPRPPRGGRQIILGIDQIAALFLSTPSARRATVHHLRGHDRVPISIHALREEGDQRMP